jgi:hypothetical protein
VKSVRFTQVVKECGQPHVHTLWLAPENDPELKRARGHHRVMTVESSQVKTDRGRVGYEPSPGNIAEVLIFPQSLQRFAGAQVVGVKFDLVAQPKQKTVPPHAWSKAPPRRPAAAGRPKAMPQALEKLAAVRPAPSRPPAKTTRSVSPSLRGPDPSLRREVHSALKELEEGKAVAAYQRLLRAVQAAEKGG